MKDELSTHTLVVSWHGMCRLARVVGKANSRSFVSQACSGCTPMSQYSMLQRAKFVGEVTLISSQILAGECLQRVIIPI